MGEKCLFCGKSRQNNTTLHKFPLHKEKILKQWVQNIGFGADFIPTKSMRLCSDHFTADSFYKVTKGVMLLDDSIPTIFGFYKSQCVYCKKKKSDKGSRSFHRFPLHDQEILMQWLKRMEIKDFVPSNHNYLCSDHFEDTCYYYYKNRKTLKKSAVPTKFTNHQTKETIIKHQIHENVGNQSYIIPGAPQKYSSDDSYSVSSSTSIISITPVCIQINSEKFNQAFDSSLKKIVNVSQLRKAQRQHIRESSSDETKVLKRRLLAAHKKIVLLKQQLRSKQSMIRRMRKKITSCNKMVKKEIHGSEENFLLSEHKMEEIPLVTGCSIIIKEEMDEVKEEEILSQEEEFFPFETILIKEERILDEEEDRGS